MGVDYYGSKNAAAVTVAAAGSDQAGAALLTAGVLNVVTGATGSNGARLPVATAGEIVRVYPSAATNALLVFPPTGGTINNGSANASLSCAARKPVVFECIDGTAWTGQIGA